MPVTAIAIAGLGLAIANARRQKKREKQYDSSTESDMARQRERQKFLDELGMPFLKSGKENMGIVESYLRRQMSGDRGLTMQTVAPEINAMADQSRGAVAAQRSALPRGGAGASAGADVPRQLQSNINNLLFSVRPRAGEQLANLGSNQASLGLGAMGQGAGLTNSMLQYGLDAQRLSMERGMAMGQGLGGLAQLFQMYYNNRGSQPQTSSLSPYTASSPNWTNPNNAARGNNIMGQSPYSFPNYSIYSSPGKST